MLAKVHLGYTDGVQNALADSSPPIYGNIFSARIQGLDVVNLWPHDFSMNAITKDSIPLHTLWKPTFSGFMDIQFGISGYECKSAGKGPRWLLQRWFVQPMALADIERELSHRPKHVR